MSRYNPKHHTVPIYEAAQKWRDKALTAEQSVLADGKKLWTLPLLDELDQRYVKNLDAGEGNFLPKLKEQLAESSDSCHQLMAEILWLLHLFPSKTRADSKRKNVMEIWSWSDEKLDPTHPLLEDTTLNGIGSTGVGYNLHRWRELVLFINALRDFKKRDASDRKQIASDPWAFSDWLSGFPEARKRQLIHILPHLLFPDTFERISSGGDKCLILAYHENTPEKEIRKRSTIKIDRALFDLRQRLEKKHSRKIDFYEEEFKAQWKPQTKKTQTKSWLLSWNPDKWTWDTLAADHDWSCSSHKPLEGDRVFVVRTSEPPKGIVAAGKVTRAPHKVECSEQTHADAGKTTLYLGVAFDSVRDAEADEIVRLEDLESRKLGQEWNPRSSGIEIKAKAAQTLERLWRALPPIETGPTTPKEVAQPLNLILYGPPGTGKTHRLMDKYLPRYRDKGEDRSKDRFEFVTFHQSYAYEDFVEGIRPITKNGAVTYKVRSGVLKRLCERARAAPDKQFALFIDELNRGNVAKVFGELITLVEVDKRIHTDASGNRLGLEVTLPYSGDLFGVPANVDIICTMNTADRSIALLDSALRRRFDFEELMPQPDLLHSIGDGEGDSIDLGQLLRKMNERLSHLLHRDQTLGHSYFLHVESFDKLRHVFANVILPLLQDAFYDDWQQIRYVLADQTVEEKIQLVRVRTQNAATLFPKANQAEISDGEAFETIDVDDITPDAIRKIYKNIYEPPE